MLSAAGKKASYSKSTKEYRDLMFAPYKTDLIVKYLNTNKKDEKILRYLYTITNNNLIKEKIVEQLENNSIYINNKHSQLFELLDEGKYEEILTKFNDKKIMVIRDKKLKGRINSIKSGLNRNSNKENFFKYYKKAMIYNSNNNLYYYLVYKTLFKMEDYLSAYSYLAYLHKVDHYKYIEEDLLDICYIAAVKHFNEKNYIKSWMISVEGMKYIDKVSYNRNIDKIIKLKDILFKSSQKLLNSENKIKDKTFYIIQTTQKNLIGENK